MNRGSLRITGWDYDNPPEVERTFRQGFLEGLELGLRLPQTHLLATYEKAMGLRGRLYHSDRWGDARAARLRGISHGLWCLYQCFEDGVSLRGIAEWTEQVRAWAVADLPTIGPDGRILGALPPEPAADSPSAV